MNISHLRCFLSVYEKRNISKAAEACFLPQQAVSRLIKNLEETYGVPLFTRTARGVVPTEYGETLSVYARHMVEEADAAQAAMEALRKKNDKRISVGMLIGTFNQYSVLPSRLFDLFMQQHPDCSIEISELSCQDCIRGVLDGNLDMAYVVNCPKNNSLSSTTLAEEASYVAFSFRYKLAKCNPLQLCDFRDVTLLYHRNNPLPLSEVERAFQSVDFVPEAVPICESIGEMVEWTRLGRGIMLSGKTSFQTLNLQGLIVKPFPEPNFVHVHSIISSSQRKLSPLARELMDFLIQNKNDIV